MRDYSDQPNWREPDPETVHENETAGILVALFFAAGIVAGLAMAGVLS